MWTGRATKHCAIVLGATLLVACSHGGEPAAPQSAWWHDIDFTPTSTIVRDVDIRILDQSWESATALDQTLLTGRVSEDEIDAFAQSPMVFSLMSDLNGDGLRETFFVGVYKTADGEQGRFVSILGEGRAPGVFKERGATGFSALMPGESEVRWYKCMECGEFESIIWSGESYVLE